MAASARAFPSIVPRSPRPFEFEALRPQLRAGRRGIDTADNHLAALDRRRSRLLSRIGLSIHGVKFVDDRGHCRARIWAVMAQTEARPRRRSGSHPSPKIGTGRDWWRDGSVGLRKSRKCVAPVADNERQCSGYLYVADHCCGSTLSTKSPERHRQCDTPEEEVTHASLVSQGKARTTEKWARAVRPPEYLPVERETRQGCGYGVSAARGGFSICGTAMLILVKSLSTQLDHSAGALVQGARLLRGTGLSRSKKMRPSDVLTRRNPQIG
jgi:hypothetical protein